MRTFILAFLLFVPAVLPAFGQEEKEQDILIADHTEQHTMETVVVEDKPIDLSTPDRMLSPEEAEMMMIDSTPGGVGFVDEKQIEESRANTLKDMLNYVPGVIVRNRYADDSQVIIRGSGLRSNFHLRGVTVLMDGYVYGNADGFSDLETIEPLTLKYIEIFKGANSLRFGGNTLGGAINFVTKTGYDAGLLEARSQVGSFGYFKNYLGTGQVYGPFDFYTGLTDTELLDPYRKHGKQARRRAYGNFGYEADDGTSYRLDVTYVRNEENYSGALTFQEYKDNPRQANPESVLYDEGRFYDYYRIAFGVRKPIGTNQALEFLTQVNITNMDHPLSFAVLDMDTYNIGGELRYLYNTSIGGMLNNLTMGVQFYYTLQQDQNWANDFGKRGEKTKDQDNKSLLTAYYIEDQLFLAPQFSILGGARVQYAHRTVKDHFLVDDDDASGKTDFFSVTPKVGFIWQTNPDVQFFGNVSTNYEPPIMVELTSPGNLGGLGSLKAQKALQFELGTRGMLWDRVRWDVSVYDYEIWDEIQNVNVQPFPDAPFTVPKYQNIDRTRHFGVEAGADILLLENLAWRNPLASGDTLRSITSYTYSHYVFVDDPVFGDNDLPGAPPHYFVSELRYDMPVGVWVAPSVESVFESYYVNSENTAKAGSYTIFNLEVGWEFAGVMFFAELSNVFDKNYISGVVVDDANGRYFYPGDGRAFYGGIQWTWQKGATPEGVAMSNALNQNSVTNAFSRNNMSYAFNHESIR
ncbi:MAG TPA: TonB-dependent receptor [Thermodesulfobacteriota bacterium]|nr:TonB-dependent receptor [Thermodesulfobacteriota bacterium]